MTVENPSGRPATRPFDIVEQLSSEWVAALRVRDVEFEFVRGAEQ